MSSTIPLLLGAGAGAYLLLRKKKPAAPNVVITASPPSAYQMPPSASPTDLAPPKSEIVDIQGFGAVPFASLHDLSEVGAYIEGSIAAAKSGCPKSVQAYQSVLADLNDYIQSKNLSGGSTQGVSMFKSQIESANVLCRAEAKAAGRKMSPTLVLDTPHDTGSGNMLALFAVAAVGAYLMFS